MSEVKIKSVKIDSITQHPNADKLEIASIGGYTVVVQKGIFKVGEVVIHFPPDILIPGLIADQLGVTNYLKHDVYPGDIHATKCRVGAVRLRGQPSFGFLHKTECTEIGYDWTNYYFGVKFDQPEKITSGNQAPDHPKFHRYTDIENYRKPEFRNAIPEGERVCITEKLHGTNCRCGLIDGEFMCGSHNVRKKDGLYWEPLNDNLRALLKNIPNGIVFGEIFGLGIQDMDYGFKTHSFRVVDISCYGVYLNWQVVKDICQQFDVPTVPELYVGPFSHQIVQELVDGPTTLGTPLCKFKGREGIVIKPLIEQYSKIVGGRLILKAVSVDYLQRRTSDSH